MAFPRNRQFWAVSLGHMTNDVFMSMGPVLLVFIAAFIFPISNAQIGVAIGLQQLFGAISQPLFGYLGDNGRGRLYGAGGVAWTIAMLTLSFVLASFGQFWLMIVPFVLAALGSGAFHPVGAKIAAEVNAAKAAGNLSYFFLLGQIGLALGPALAGVLLDRAHTYNYLFAEGLGPSFEGLLTDQGTVTPLFALSVLAVFPVIFMMTSLTEKARLEQEEATQATMTQQKAMSGSLRDNLPVKAITIVAVLITVRALATPGIVQFIPRLFQLRGWDASAYGLVQSLYWLGSGFAGVVFGNLADRYGRRPVILWSMCASAPAYFLLPIADGWVALLMAVLAGSLSGASHSVLVAMVQELIPVRKGFASGSVLGFMFGTGALATMVVGWLSSRIGAGELQGLTIMFYAVAILAFVSGLMALLLPRTKPEPVRVTDTPDVGAVPAK